MTNIKIILITLLIFVAVFDVKPAEDEINVLAGDKVRDIEADEKCIWVATSKGVNRFDFETKSWKLITTADGLVNNSVNCISVEWKEGFFGKSEGRYVWFGTDSGLSVYDKKTGEWEKFTVEDGLLDNTIRKISARSDDVWVVTGNGVSVYNKDNNKWTSYSSFPNMTGARITSVYHDYRYAWIGTNKGLVRYNYKYKGRYNHWEHFRKGSYYWISPTGSDRPRPKREMEIPKYVPDVHINAIDGKGNKVYIATIKGLRIGDVTKDVGFRKDTSEELWDSFKLSQARMSEQEKVSDNFVDIDYSHGVLWIATSRGLVKLDPDLGYYEIFSKEHDFVSNKVMTVAAIKGQVWAGTPHGLAVKGGIFDRDWKVFKVERALPSNYVTAVGVDDRWVWFGTPGAASRFNPETERWQTYTRDDGLAGSQIRSIAVVGNYVWFGTDEGISRLDKHTKKISHYSQEIGLTSNDITAIVVDGRYVWVGTAEGLNRYDKVENKVVRSSQSHINALAVDPRLLWIGTPDGLSSYNKTEDVRAPATKFVLREEAGKAITDIVLNENFVCVASKTNGLNVWNRKTREWQKKEAKGQKGKEAKLPISAIKTIALDDNKLWVGSRGSLCQLNLVTKEVRGFTDADAKGISHAEFLDAVNTPNYVWFTTDSGIYRYNKSTDDWWTYSPYKNRGQTELLVDSDIRCITSSKGFAYFGTPLGISRYDKLTGNWVNYTEQDGLTDVNVRGLAPDGNDLWVATQGGVCHYDFVADEWQTFTRKHGLPHEDSYCVVNSGDSIWVGTKLGAARYDKISGTWHSYTIEDGLPDKEVWAIAIEGSDVWFGTNEGVAVLNTELDKWRWFTSDDGLVSDVVKSISVGRNYIFINTPNGTTAYDKRLGTFTNFSQIDGLVSNNVQTLDSIQRYFWFGTNRGVTLYDQVIDLPEEIFTSNSGLAGDSVQAIRIDSPYAWIGTDSGLSQFNLLTGVWTQFHQAPKKGKETRAQGLISYNLKSLANDYEYLWVGTRTGLSCYDKEIGEWRPTKLSSASGEIRPNIRSITVDGRFLWLGTNHGALLFDKTVQQIIPTDNPAGNSPVREIIVAEDGQIWFTYPDKVIVLRREYGENIWEIISGATVEERIPGATPRIEQAESDFGFTDCTAMLLVDEQAWVGKTKGIAFFDTEERESITDIDVPQNLAKAKVTDFAYDSENVWVGTRNGLYQYHLSSKRWYKFTTQNGLASNRISTVAVDVYKQDAYPMVWVGTADAGVSRYDRTQSEWRNFDIDDGVAGNNVRAILIDEDYVWFGTFSGGLCRYDKSSGLWTTYRPAKFATHF